MLQQDLRRVRRAADAPAGVDRGLRQVRALAEIGAETMVMDFRPDQPMHNRYAVSHDFLTPETGEEILTISAADQRVLPLGVQLLRDARARHRGAPDRLRQRVAGRRADVAALLLPVGDQRAAEVDDLLHRDRPRVARAWTWTRAATSRSATARTSPTRRSSPSTGKLADDYFEVERVHGVLRDRRWRTSTS